MANSLGPMAKQIALFYKELRLGGVGRHLAAELTLVLTKEVLTQTFRGGNDNGN